MIVPHFETLDQVWLDGAELQYLGEAGNGPLFSRSGDGETVVSELIPYAALHELLQQGRLIVRADGRKSRKRK